MKKTIILILSISAFFANDLASAQCFSDVYYNGQRVTYCVGNNEYDASYNSSDPYYSQGYRYGGGYQYAGYDSCGYYGQNCGGYGSQSSSYSSDGYSHNGYYYQGERVYESPQNTSNPSGRSREDNYYNMIYMNGLESRITVDSVPDTTRGIIVTQSAGTEKFDDINLKKQSFSTVEYRKAYDESVKYVSRVKTQTVRDYENGYIKAAKVEEIRNDLEYLVYYLDTRYQYLKDYETTRSTFYRDTAIDYAGLVKTAYDTLEYARNN